MSRIIALANQKGGVGKTTTAINVATGLAISERKTLLVDLDPQCNATTGVSSLLKNNSLKINIYDLFVNEKSVSDAITPTSIPYLDVVQSTHDLVGAEVELVGMLAREYRLKDIIFPIVSNYEFVLLDCPPSLGLLTINAFACSTSVLIPIQCEFFALEGLSHLLQTIRLVQRHLNTRLEIEGVLITMFDSRLKLSRQVEEEVRSYFTEKTFKTVIRRNIRLGESPSFGQPILLYDASSTGAQDYLSLTEEILNSEGSKTR